MFRYIYIYIYPLLQRQAHTYVSRKKGRVIVSKLPTLKLIHTIHVMYIYLHLVDFMANAGKYTSPMDARGNITLEKRPFQKDVHPPTISFSGASYLCFRLNFARKDHPVAKKVLHSLRIIGSQDWWELEIPEPCEKQSQICQAVGSNDYYVYIYIWQFPFRSSPPQKKNVGGKNQQRTWDLKQAVLIEWKWWFAPIVHSSFGKRHPGFANDSSHWLFRGPGGTTSINVLNVGKNGQETTIRNGKKSNNNNLKWEFFMGCMRLPTTKRMWNPTIWILPCKSLRRPLKLPFKTIKVDKFRFL